MVHTLQIVNTNFSNIAEQTMWREMVKIINLTCATPTMKDNASRQLVYTSDDSYAAQFANILFTMKSARDGKLMNELDIAGEILSQYLVGGGIRFNRVADWDLSRTANKVVLKNFDTVMADAQITAAETAISEACRAQFEELVGEVISF